MFALPAPRLPTTARSRSATGSCPLGPNQRRLLVRPSDVRSAALPRAPLIRLFHELLFFLSHSRPVPPCLDPRCVTSPQPLQKEPLALTRRDSPRDRLLLLFLASLLQRRLVGHLLLRILGCAAAHSSSLRRAAAGGGRAVGARGGDSSRPSSGSAGERQRRMFDAACVCVWTL